MVGNPGCVAASVLKLTLMGPLFDADTIIPYLIKQQCRN